MKELDDVKKIFLASNVDDEDRADNEAKIREWEKGLQDSEELAGWLDHPVTKTIMQQARSSFVELSLALLDRRLIDARRIDLFAQREAMIWLLTFASKDPKADIESINNDIKRALNATN